MNPLALAKQQLALDAQRMAKRPWLLAHKQARMELSAFAFLRGTAPLFYQLLKREPTLARGPSGTGWIAGDLHLENFGCYRPHVPERGRAAAVAFDVNDFDDALIAPLWWDVLRGVTSLLLATRQLGFPGRGSLALAHDFLEAHSEALFGKRRAAPPPPSIQKLLALAAQKTRADLLLGRTEGEGHHRRFSRGRRYLDISRTTAREVQRSFERYARTLSGKGSPAPESLQVQDVAFRVAGTGSLGALRYAVLVHGKGGKDGAWMFDMKEEGMPAAAALIRPQASSGAQRVLTALRRCLAQPPTLAGAVMLGRSSMLVRRLAPQEERLSVGAVPPAEWEHLVPFLASLVAGVHRRAATGTLKRWSGRDRTRLLEGAIRLAGIHEATYLAFCQLTLESRGTRRRHA